MLPDDNLTVSETPDVDRDHPDGHHLDRDHSRRAQGTYQHPQIRSLIAKHCEQLSSGLVDVFRTEVEREVKQRVSEVIVSEATACWDQLRSKDEALLAAETRFKDLQGQLELSNQMCRQLQGRIKQLETTETELRMALNERIEVVRASHPQIMFFIHPLLSQQAGVAPLLLDSRHLAVVYERRDGRMICRLCVYVTPSPA